MPASEALARKRDIILAHEGDFARALGARVVDKPVVSIWMVLIPILFLHYMYRHQKFKAGVAAFAAEFLKPREQAMALALGTTEQDDTEPPAGGAGISAAARELERAEAAQVAVLVEHYRRLLEAEGSTYGDLVRRAYPGRADYETHLYELGETDGDINAAVLKAAPGDAAVGEIIRCLDQALRAMRGDELALFYGSPDTRRRAPG